ncbi:ABC transporter ATP-binding protein [Pseudogemmobacter faecipullorum]|uniref:ABC transporter ATP-binding protein n=1 Tax=Pseudogemmobacter faecipullorum TaxID=2755041 RepID=A0ABS8CGD5_9RHOB|nr:ABC transporter ATP-binding protein [Pseudogemmobacter faecipullorum]MCB5408456.1 ABC transporter ATP-binding protein [Pseudogemmobacter faecipullorum]
MIRLENLSKSFRTPGGARKVVAQNISAVFPSGVAVALLGRNGAGKSTLMEMISGKVRPGSGRIVVRGTVSWPVGFSGSFHGDLTGAQNTRFIARTYGVDSDELIAHVAEFAELGDHFTSPVRTYSAGMKSRLAFGVSIGIPFDTYLVDEVTSVGDAAFREKSKRYFLARMQTAGAIFVSHSMPQIREFCQSGAVLENGRLHYFDDLEEAIRMHEENMAL